MTVLVVPTNEELEIARGDNHLGFRSPETSVYTRLIEGPYPNYEQVIPKDNDKVAVAEKGQLISALKRMSVIASDQTHRIRLSFNAGMLKFAVQTPDLGEAADEMPVRYDGDPLDIGFNVGPVTSHADAFELTAPINIVPTVLLVPTARASRAATAWPCSATFGSQLAAIAIGTGMMVRRPWMTS